MKGREKAVDKNCLLRLKHGDSNLNIHMQPVVLKLSLPRNVTDGESDYKDGENEVTSRL